MWRRFGGYATLLQDSSRDQLENATNQVSAILEKAWPRAA